MITLCAQIFWVFFKISFLSFGGVFGVLPELERMIVGEHGWMTHERFIQSYVISQFVPGPNMAMCPLIGYWVAGLRASLEFTYLRYSSWDASFGCCVAIMKFAG